MMTPIKHPSSNHNYGAPAYWDEAIDGECRVLPVTVRPGYLYSYWKPSLIDCIRILFGTPVRLCIVGKKSHPVVSLEVTDN